MVDVARVAVVGSAMTIRVFRESRWTDSAPQVALPRVTTARAEIVPFSESHRTTGQRRIHQQARAALVATVLSYHCRLYGLGGET